MDLVWQTELVRVSLFSNGPIKVSDADWQAITGQDEAATRTQIPSGRALIGPALDGQLTVATTGPRVTCILSFPKQPSEDSSLKGKIGRWPETLHTFQKATAPWLGSLKFPITRIGLGLILQCEAPSREEANDLLGRLLKSVTVSPKMEDLLFRVNWLRHSGCVDGLVINRLTTWSVAKVVTSTLTITEATEATVESIGINVVRLELDHNTHAEWAEPFEVGKITPLYEELTTLAIESAENGEVQ